MGWKGTLRSIAAAQRRAEREALRRQRELERQRKKLEKMREMERAAYEVQVYENYLDVLNSVHKDCSDNWDWEALKSANPPAEPQKENRYENSAQRLLDSYKPSFIDKLLRRAEKKRVALENKVEEGRKKDESEHKNSMKEFEQKYEEWKSLRDLSTRILAGDEQAYIEAINQADIFEEIKQLGSWVEFKTHGNELIQATVHVNSEEVIPNETKTLLKSGKLSVKKMPKTRFYGLYQDYVCGCVLRVARELFALLPIEMTIVTAVAKLLNTATGHLEDQPILSVAIPRDTINGLNFSRLDPSDSMDNFVHKMKCLKTKGFRAVEEIAPTDFL